MKLFGTKLLDGRKSSSKRLTSLRERVLSFEDLERRQLLSISPAGGSFSIFTQNETELLGNALNGARHDEGKNLVVTLDSDPDHGSLLLQEDGEFTYRPEEEFVGFDEFTCTVSTSDGSESQVATVVLNVIPEMERFVGPIVESVEDQFASDPLMMLSESYAAGLDVDGNAILATCFADPNPTSMVRPRAQGDFNYQLSQEFVVHSMSDVTGSEAAGTGVVSVHWQVMSRDDGLENGLWLETIYCSYSFTSEGNLYTGEYTTRLEAFSDGGIESYCYTSTTLDRSEVTQDSTVNARRETREETGSRLELNSTTIAYRRDNEAMKARGLEIRTQAVTIDRSGGANVSKSEDGRWLARAEEELERSTTYSITRFDYDYLPGVNHMGPFLDPHARSDWGRSGTRQESGSDVATTSYEVATPRPVRQRLVGPLLDPDAGSGNRALDELETQTIGQNGATTKTHQFTAISVLRDEGWETMSIGTRTTESNTDSTVERPLGGVSIGSQSQSESLFEVETYEIMMLAGVVSTGTVTLTGSASNAETSSHSGTYTTTSPAGSGAWIETSQYSYSDTYSYAKTYDTTEEEWELSSGCSETVIAKSTSFRDDAHGTLASGYWDEGVAKKNTSIRTVDSTVNASGEWEDSGSEDFTETNYSYHNETENDIAYSRSITGGTLAGDIGTYEGKIHSYAFSGTKTLTDNGGNLEWVLTSGCGFEFDAESTGASYDGEGCYNLTGCSGCGPDLVSWDIDGAVDEYGRIGDGEALITDYEVACGEWSVTDVEAALYNSEQVNYLDTSTGTYTDGAMCGEVTQRDSEYHCDWNASVWESDCTAGLLEGKALEEAFLRLDNASHACGEVTDYYDGVGCEYGQATYQREDSDASCFLQETRLMFTLEEDTSCGGCCGTGGGTPTYSWQHESGILEELARREISNHRGTDTPQQLSPSYCSSLGDIEVDFDEEDRWSYERDERWEIVPESSDLHADEPYYDRVDVWEQMDGTRTEKFGNDYELSLAYDGTSNYSYDGQTIEGATSTTRDTTFGRDLTISGVFDDAEDEYDFNYTGTGYESLDENYTFSGCFDGSTASSCCSGCCSPCCCCSGGGGSGVTYDGCISFAYSRSYETDRNLVYSKAATQQNVYDRTIYDGPTELSGGCCSAGGIPSQGSWSSYGWQAEGTGTGTMAESWQLSHWHNRDWQGAPVTTTLLTGTQSETTSDAWSYSLNFDEERPLGTATSWKYTDVTGSGSGCFLANKVISGSGSYSRSVKQGLATLNGTKTYDESLVERNAYTIGFDVTVDGKITFLMDGLGEQELEKEFKYAGTTGATSYNGGNGSISLSEAGCVSMWQLREVDWEYSDGGYDADVHTAKCTAGTHSHDYENTNSYSGCGYSSSSEQSWWENSTWSNELHKYHTYSDSSWATLWSNRFTSYEQMGNACGDGYMEDNYWSSSCCGAYNSTKYDEYDYTGWWSEDYDSLTDTYTPGGRINNDVSGYASCGCGCGCSYSENVSYIGFHDPTFVDTIIFQYVSPTQVGKLHGAWDASCISGCGTGCNGLYGYETYVPIGRNSDTTSTSTIGRLPTATLISPSDMTAKSDLHSLFGDFRDLPEPPAAALATSLANYRNPNAIHGNGSPSLPQNAIFSDWGHWRDHSLLNADLDDAIAALAALTGLTRTDPLPLKEPGEVVLDLYDTDNNGDDEYTVSASGELRADASDPIVEASISGGLKLEVPEGSTNDGMSAATLESRDSEGLLKAYTVKVHVVAVDGYTVQEQAWGETTWDAPEDSGTDWALLWRSNDYRWQPHTTSDGFMTGASWTADSASFASVTVDSSRERWAYGEPDDTGVVDIDTTVTFGGDTIYFDTLNPQITVGMIEDTTPTAKQPKIAVNYIKSVEWEEVAYSRTVDGLGLAQLDEDGDEHVVYPDVTAAGVYDKVRVKVELAEAVPSGMQGTVQVVWYDPDNTLANIPATPPSNDGWGTRDNSASLSPTTVDLMFVPYDGSDPTPEIEKAVFTVQTPRYGDNFIAVAHPHDDIAKTYEFRENDEEEIVLMHPETTGEWTEVPNDPTPADPDDLDHRTTVLTILPPVDIDTDSDNTGAIDRTEAEDYVEYRADEPGKIIFLNNDDDDGNSTPDYLDTTLTSPDDDLHRAVLELGFPDTTGMGDLTLVLTCSNHLFMWADNLKTELPVANSVVRGVHYEWAIPSSGAVFPSEIYVEGLVIGRGVVSWSIQDSGDNVIAIDRVTFTVTGADLDVDSDNNNVLSRNLAEELVEDPDDEPGKIIRSRLADYSDSDRVPDFADGYDLDGTTGNDDDNQTGAPAFTPMVLEVYDEIDLSVATFTFDYEASAPTGVTESGGVYTAAAGNLRIWREGVGANYAGRDGTDLSIGGDFIGDGVVYTATQLGLSSGDREVTFGLEGIHPGVSTIDILIDPDGAGSEGYTVMDSVKITVIYVDLDVNNNGALFDSVDGVDVYMPGYEGTTNKLTTGTTFNTVSYAAQHMKIIADGIGSGQGIDSVEYSISDYTYYEGYAENKTAYFVTGPTRNDDYSFANIGDDRTATGTMTATNTYADFYCKDFGGASTVVVSIKKDGTTIFTWTLDVPRDADSDGIADRWEREQIAEWNTQFGYSHDVNDLTFVNPTYDYEMADPDAASNTDGGTNLPAHKAVGDSLTEFQEYRGFILDGGNSHTGGHKRLSKAKKELLVEVDIMAGVTNMPSVAGVCGVMDTTSSGFNDIDDGAGIDLYYVVDETAATHEVFGSYSDRQDWADDHRHKTNGTANMLSEFVYLAFADSSSDGSMGGVSSTYGAYVFVDKIHSVYSASTPTPSSSFNHWLAYVSAHEITHQLMPDWSGDDNNIDASNPADSDSDKQYLMYPYFNGYISTGSYTADDIVFSNKARTEINLTSKRSVER